MDAGQTKQVPRQWVKEYLFPIGSLLIGILGLLAQTAFPMWIVVIATLYLIIIAAVFLFSPVTRFFSSVKAKWRLRRIAKMNLPELVVSVKKFNELIAPQNSNTLAHVFSLVAQWDGQKGKVLLPDPEYIETIRNWLLAIEKRTESCTPRDFSCLCAELSSLFQQYNHFLCQRLARMQGLIHEGSLSPDRIRQIKQYWNVNRDAHIALVRTWERFAKKMNERTASKLCIDYYQPLGTLE